MDFIKKYATEKPSVAATIDESGRQWTYQELFRLRSRLVNSLKAQGFVNENQSAKDTGKGIVFCLNRMEASLSGQALTMLGLISIVLNWRLTSEEIEYIVNDSGAKLFFVDENFYPKVKQLLDASKLPTVKKVILIDQVQSSLLSNPPTSSSLSGKSEVKLSELVKEGGEDYFQAESGGGSMTYTGGTTGRPKGAYRERSNPQIMLRYIQALDLFYPNNVHLLAAPIYHAAPGAFAALTFVSGGTLVFMKKYRPQLALELIEKYKVTSTFMAPTLLKMLLDLPPPVLQKFKNSGALKTMRNIILGAAPCPHVVKEKTVELFGPNCLYEFYGSSELGINTVLHPKDQLRKPGSCGKAVEGIEIHLLDQKGNEVGVGQEGILYVRRHEGLIQAYWNDAEKTEKMFLGDYATVGDIAKRDEEGFIYICDRAIDLIISGGVNIYPAEVEGALHRHPAVVDCAVFGVPDDHWGERVHAAVVLKEGHKVTEKEFNDFLRKLIADYKVPREYSFHKSEDFPRDNAGKIQKKKLKEPYWKSRQSKL